MRLERLARFLAPRLKAWAGVRKPDFQIVKARVGSGKDLPEGSEVYLNRWHVIKPRWWRPGAYLHQMLKDDDAVLHDHPYWSVSLCLGEGLRERYVTEPAKNYMGWIPGLRANATFVRYPDMGDVIFRSSTMAHQLQVLPGKEPWTLFITGRRLPKEWGFWCPKGWTHFKKYVTIKNGQSGVGQGCGED